MLFFALTLCAMSGSRTAGRSYPDYSGGSGYVSFHGRVSLLKNAEVLCRVWGYVKYHHPAFADTTLNADYELFGLLPKVMPASAAERNRILSDWIDGLGPFTPAPDEYRRMLDTLSHSSIVDLDWIGDRRELGRKLSRTLADLRYARRDRVRYAERTLSLDPATLGYCYGNETDCFQGMPPDLGGRMLALFRYWNIIEYFFPYKGLTDTPWREVLTRHLVDVMRAATWPDYRAAMGRVVAEVCDTHAFSADPLLYICPGYRRVPFDLRVVEGRMIVVSAQEYDDPPIDDSTCFRPGDEILSVGGRTVDSLKKAMKEFCALSNEASLDARLADFMPVSDRTLERVRFVRDSVVRDTVVRTLSSQTFWAKRNRARRQERPYRLIGDSIGYIYAGAFYNEYVDEIVDKLWHTKAIVFDLRAYPSEPLIYPFINDRVLDDRRPGAIFSIPVPLLPGYFYDETGSYGRNNPDAYRGRIVVLADERSMSQSETTIMELQSRPGTVTVGSQTKGANGDLSRVTMPGSFTSTFSGYGVRYPDGRQTQRTGVRIDVEARPTVRGIAEGRDEVLEKALEIIERNAER